MPVAIPNGGGDSDPTTSELAAYHSSKAASGDSSGQEQDIVKAVEAKVEAVAAGWIDSGGTGGRQAAVALEIAEFTGDLEARRMASINQWAQAAAKGSRKAQTEMHGADTPSIVNLAKLLFELRERLNDSPY